MGTVRAVERRLAVLEGQQRAAMMILTEWRPDAGGQKMDTMSQLQARYAQTILRVARGAEKAIAIRLIECLASDCPARGVAEEQARLHNAAIGEYLALLKVLRDGGAAPPWTTAITSTERWLARA